MIYVTKNAHINIIAINTTILRVTLYRRHCYHYYVYHNRNLYYTQHYRFGYHHYNHHYHHYYHSMKSATNMHMNLPNCKVSISTNARQSMGKTITPYHQWQMIIIRWMTRMSTQKKLSLLKWILLSYRSGFISILVYDYMVHRCINLFHPRLQ